MPDTLPPCSSTLPPPPAPVVDVLGCPVVLDPALEAFPGVFGVAVLPLVEDVLPPPSYRAGGYVLDLEHARPAWAVPDVALDRGAAS